VLDGLPMSLAEFFTLDLGTPPADFLHGGRLVELGGAEVAAACGSPAPWRQLTILHERYAAGAGTGDEMIVHRVKKAVWWCEDVWSLRSLERHVSWDLARRTTSRAVAASIPQCWARGV